MKTLDNALSWYEASLPSKERKRRGHFSTPPALVEQILDACGYTSEADLTAVRVLDPACGGGNFLVEAAHRLMAFGTRIGLDRAAQTALIQQNIWGLDPDPIACFLAEMQLIASLQETCRLHIHQADGLALAWEPCVDLFVANPPYLATKNTDLSGYQSAQQRGQADSYLLFLNVALQIVRPRGWMALVLPDPVLARANAAKERTRLLQEVTIHHVWHLANVFSAEVGAVVLIAQKCPPPSLHQVSWLRGKWQQSQTATPQGAGRAQASSRPYAPLLTTAALSQPVREDQASPSKLCEVAQALFLRQPNAELRYLLSSKGGVAIERLRAHLDSNAGAFAPLSDFLSISRGEELGKNNPHITSCNDQTHVQCLPVLLGGSDIRPYRPPTATHYIASEAVAKPLQRYLSPKLLVVKSTDRLQATLDLQGHVALQTLYLLHARTTDTSADDLYFFLALLNSRLLREYVYMLYTAYKWVQPQIEQSVLARLPIPLTSSPAERQYISTLARQLLHTCSAGALVVEWNEHIHSMYAEQERAICALYSSALPRLFTNEGVIVHG